jgi:hypothetical protein
MDKCLAVYQKIQNMAPGEPESHENINIIKGAISPEQIIEYMRKGENIVASLLLGHYLENQLKTFTRRKIGTNIPGLYDCLKELDRFNRLTPFKKELFQKVLRLRNKAVHHPSRLSEEDFDSAINALKLLKAKF